MTGAEFILGAFASCLASHADPTGQSLEDVIVAPFPAPRGVAIPPDHDA